MNSPKWKLIRTLALLMALLSLLSTALISCGDGGKNDDTTTTGDPNQTPTPEYPVITIAEALELCGESGNVTTERYYIRGIVQSVTSTQYGAMIIKDATGEISVYGTYSADGQKTYPELDYQPVKGDEVLLHCILQNYNGKKEVKNARLIEYKNNQGSIDVSNYTPATVAEARSASKGANLKVSGVVARITYATGQVPSGFILIDETASIYVYDGDAARRVKIGNKVELAGTKDYWILDKEQQSAAKFGYKGCNQLTDVFLISNDNKTDNAFPTASIKESTVKDILETPITEDVTTIVYKVNALVCKKQEPGFTNYYFYDLDGTTGSYTYTQCNGADFGWLDAFDGKICTVYLTALNAKSSASGCNFRLLPVAVSDDNFTFDTTTTPAHVLKYYAMDQFRPYYTGNPELPMVTTVSSALLGFTGATVTYSSDNTDVVTFTVRDGQTIMECLAPGTATVTVTATYNAQSVSETVNIQVIDLEALNAISVRDAIDSDLNTEVTVRGIVGPSLVNKDGFYLIDDSGIIAVLVNDKAMFGDIAIGNEIILTGKRDLAHTKDGTHFGQTHISGATLEANLYGAHQYNTDFFVTDKTLADFYDLDVTKDYSTTVFLLNATVVEIKESRYTAVKLQSGTTTVTLYCSGAKQYSFLSQFFDKEVTLELAACNWNNKSFWAGCVLAVHTEDGKILNTLNFDH